MIEVCSNDRSAEVNYVNRKIAVDKGNVDINNVIEEMIDSLEKSKQPL